VFEQRNAAIGLPINNDFARRLVLAQGAEQRRSRTDQVRGLVIAGKSCQVPPPQPIFPQRQYRSRKTATFSKQGRFNGARASEGRKTGLSHTLFLVHCSAFRLRFRYSNLFRISIFEIWIFTKGLAMSADKTTQALIDALKQAMAQPGEHRLYKSGK